MRLILAPAAQTDTSIAVVWDKPAWEDRVEEISCFLRSWKQKEEDAVM